MDTEVAKCDSQMRKERMRKDGKVEKRADRWEEDQNQGKTQKMPCQRREIDGQKYEKLPGGQGRCSSILSSLYIY